MGTAKVQSGVSEEVVSKWGLKDKQKLAGQTGGKAVLAEGTADAKAQRHEGWWRVWGKCMQGGRQGRCTGSHHRLQR